VKVVVTAKAEKDLVEACAYIAKDSPAAAHEFLARFDELTKMLASGVVEGPPVRLAGGQEAHSWPLKPYRIYYRRRGGALEVLRIYHQACRPIER
jgi:plasmid stabilization system protein ParE